MEDCEGFFYRLFSAPIKDILGFKCLLKLFCSSIKQTNLKHDTLTLVAGPDGYGAAYFLFFFLLSADCRSHLPL